MFIENQQYCTFQLEGLFFGIEVHKVQEVLRYQEMTRVPIASRVIRGLINLRGQLVTAIDLRRRLGLDDREDAEPPMNVIVNTSDGAVSFLVDEIGDVIQVTGEVFERPPMTMGAKLRHLVHGVCKLEGQLMLILDVERAIDLEAD
ncbi:MAG: chemotaxis protein CheW [Myxococcales bacterium]|nr:chemotaxis protein CheW [Myxococcales bacterium]